MEGQPYSLAFRRRYPKFNGLIWAYHWLQVGLYEPLVTARSSEERRAGVDAAVARFRAMLADPPRSMPTIMPMTAAVAPEFSRRYPEIAIIFDNLHAMHDVISDVLASYKLMKSLNPEVVVTGHGPVSTTKVFDEYEGFYTLLLKRVGDMAAQGKSLAEIKKELTMPEYADWHDQDRLGANIDAAYKSVKK